MKHSLWLLIFTIHFTEAQKLNKADKVLLSNLEMNINYLSADKLEGRRTGTNGEKLAYEYIVSKFQQAGLAPKGDKETFLQEFEINDGKEVTAASHFNINGNDLTINKDYFPFSFCPNSTLEATASIALQENSNPWFFDIKELIDTNKSNPDFDLVAAIKTKALDAAKKGANAFVIFNSSVEKDGLKFEPRSESILTTIPVIYICSPAREKYLKDETATLEINLKINIDDKKRYGHNVIGYIDNHAATTIILGAHYDHLGYGEDHNSLFTGEIPEIHNGADDNASGTGALIELGGMLKTADLKNNNYLLIAFSGEELGLFGSKYFTSHPTTDLSKTNYMINMDMIGRLKDNTHGLNIGGYGSSPQWGNLFSKKDKYFNLNFDSSGSGPSDHSSFYRKNIPVLFFFTGTHDDYHKPSDDADKINYTGELQVVKLIFGLISKTNNSGQLAFTKTRETTTSTTSNFKVTLGIMPDYTFNGQGVKADGVTDGKAAKNAGIQPGDVITQLGEYKCSDLQTYMDNLNKFNKGDTTKVKVKRGGQELTLDIVF